MARFKTVNINGEIFISAADLKQIITTHGEEVSKNQEQTEILEAYIMAHNHIIEIIEQIANIGEEGSTHGKIKKV